MSWSWNLRPPSDFNRCVRQVGEAELVRAFARYGAVHSVVRARALDFGVVRFLKHSAAAAAIAGLNGAHLRERAVTVKWGSAAPPAATVAAAPHMAAASKSAPAATAPLGQGANPAQTPLFGLLGRPQAPPMGSMPGGPASATAATGTANGFSGLGIGWAQALGLGVQASWPTSAARPAGLPLNSALGHPVAPMHPVTLGYPANGSAAHPATLGHPGKGPAPYPMPLFSGGVPGARPPTSAPDSAPAPAAPQANGWAPSHFRTVATDAAAAPAGSWAGPQVTTGLPLPKWAPQARAQAPMPCALGDPAPHSPMGKALGGSGLEWGPLPGQLQARPPAAGGAGAAGKASVPGFSLFARAGPLEGLMHQARVQGPNMAGEAGPHPGALASPQQHALRAGMDFCGMGALSPSALPKT